MNLRDEYMGGLLYYCLYFCVCSKNFIVKQNSINFDIYFQDYVHLVLGVSVVMTLLPVQEAQF